MDAQQKMAEIYRQNPEIGRKGLAKKAGVGEMVARAFLLRNKGGSSSGELDHLHPAEKQAILSSMNISKPSKAPPSKWAKSSYKTIACGDTHWGHVKAKPDWWWRLCDKADKEKADSIWHAGDITEGMSGRPGHVYELNAVGVMAQAELAAGFIEQAPVIVEGITGNHDNWAHKAVGFDLGTWLETRCPGKFRYLGPDEADIEINGIKVKLWHGGDGASYATSYRTQKFVEGLSGGDKPHILFSGHAHKSIYHECRNVQCFEVGTLCGQTGWMRGKKLAAHTGFWMVEFWPASDGSGLERIRQEWVPFYEK